MRVIRTMDRGKIRQHCIEHNYYTCGNNREYSHMFDMADVATTDEEIIAVGRDIWNHSDMKDFLASGGTFADFLWGIFNKCLLYTIRED